MSIRWVVLSLGHQYLNMAGLPIAIDGIFALIFIAYLVHIKKPIAQSLTH